MNQSPSESCAEHWKMVKSEKKSEKKKRNLKKILGMNEPVSLRKLRWTLKNGQVFSQIPMSPGQVRACCQYLFIWKILHYYNPTFCDQFADLLF